MNSLWIKVKFIEILRGASLKISVFRNSFQERSEVEYHDSNHASLFDHG
jgi:hypothetical protein